MVLVKKLCRKLPSTEDHPKAPVQYYPLVNIAIAIENGPVDIVDLPIKDGGSFHSYVAVYQRVTP